jgi:hypothetical protein
MEKKQFIDFAFVKANSDFEQVLWYYNLKPLCGRSGGQLALLCPFHDDTKPSLSVAPEKKGFIASAAAPRATSSTSSAVWRSATCGMRRKPWQTFVGSIWRRRARRPRRKREQAV